MLPPIVVATLLSALALAEGLSPMRDGIAPSGPPLSALKDEVIGASMALPGLPYFNLTKTVADDPDSVVRSIQHAGSLCGMKRILDRLVEGEGLTVIALGSSVTAGHGGCTHTHPKLEEAYTPEEGVPCGWWQIGKSTSPDPRGQPERTLCCRVRSEARVQSLRRPCAPPRSLHPRHAQPAVQALEPGQAGAGGKTLCQVLPGLDARGGVGAGGRCAP
mmetsp:Transcript_66353/g.209768  ORF Transcript_66353/g.209768 Transcript_66353/m.209768 type:complete len:218 (-) Transcript_66353:659-1312(-)